MPTTIGNGLGLGIIERIYKVIYPPVVPKEEGALRCGILGAAGIAPLALVRPAKSHPGLAVHAIAARERKRAEAFARAHGVPKVYYGDTGYQDLLDDPEIDVVYNPLPNGLHYEWTVKALQAGKHVLLEKPSTNTMEDTKALFELAEKKGLVLLEAFHPRFHPAIIRMKELVDSGELGKIKSISSKFLIPQIARDDDIRCNLELGGGTFMDQGCYTLAMVRYLASANPTAVLEAHSTPLQNPSDDPKKRNIDISTTASFAFPDDVVASVEVHSRRPGWGPFGLIPRFLTSDLLVVLEGGTVSLNNFVFPFAWHSITVSPTGGRPRVEKAYMFADGPVKGEPWWTTYRYQLEAFVDKVKGKVPRNWMDGDDSVANMEWIDKVYEKTGFGARPKSMFTMDQ
ncbi:hypothetical protein M0805_004654 [Coniferiporia weirii]|nr:hypothetical protein M0805_004654 [Coniferiporia weirii]